MTVNSKIGSRELSDWLRRVLIITGYILGGWNIVQFLLLNAWDQFWLVLRSAGLRNEIWGLANGCQILAPVLLCAGCWGLQQHRGWARNLLLCYAWMWMLGYLGGFAFSPFYGNYNSLGWKMVIDTAVATLGSIVAASAFPVILALCLFRWEFRDPPIDAGRGFEVRFTKPDNDSAQAEDS
jgi:hypothetical protein